MATYRVLSIFSDQGPSDAAIAAGGTAGTLAATTAYYRHGSKKINKRAKEIVDSANSKTAGLRKEVESLKGAMKTRREGFRGYLDKAYDTVSGRTRDLGKKRAALDKQIKEIETGGRETAKRYKNLGLRKVGKATLIGAAAGGLATGAAIGLKHGLAPKEFSEDTTKLKAYDRINIGLSKYTQPKFERNLLIKSDDPRVSREEHNKATLLHAAGNIPISSALAAGVGAAVAPKGKRRKSAGNWALIGAGLGAAQAVGEVIGKNLRYEARRAYPGSKLAKQADRQTDHLRVANGDMTKEEFARKWYKNEKEFSDKKKKDLVRDAGLAGAGIGVGASVIGTVRNIRDSEKVSKIAKDLGVVDMSLPGSTTFFGDKKKVEEAAKRIKRYRKVNKALIYGGLGSAALGTGIATYRNSKNGN